MNVQTLLQHNRRLLMAAATLLLVGAIAIATSVTQADSITPSQPAEPTLEMLFPPAASAAEAAQGHAAFAERFSLFREGEEVVLASLVIRDPGIDRAAARELTVASEETLARAGALTPRSRVWVAPRYDGDQCILALAPGADGPAEVCNSAKRAADGYLLMTSSRSVEDAEIYGLVPDGVQQVVVRLADGTRSELPVVDSAYAARFTQPTEAIAFTDASGEAHELTMRSDG